jgi:HK97 family phage major capsid protein
MVTINDKILQLEQKQNAILSKSGEMLSSEDQIKYDGIEEAKTILSDMNSEGLSYGRQTAPEPIADARGLRSIPAQVKRWKGQCFKDGRTAREFLLFTRAACGDRKAEARLESEGVSFKSSMLESTNSAGGFLVPIQYSSDIIRLVEERGIFRKEGRVVDMTTESLVIPRQTAGATAYFIGEGTAITASDLTLDQITLTLKKIGCLTAFSNELSADAMAIVGDMLAKDFAYRLADKEDECAFNGNGQSTYGGIVGLRQQLIQKALGGVAAGAVPAASGLVRYGTGYSYANLTLVLLTSLIGKLPSYAESNAKWYGSKLVYSYLLDLIADAGGNTLQTLSAGPANRAIFGYPFVVTDVMPKAAAVNQVCLLFGDLKLAATGGVHTEGVRIEASNSAVVDSESCFETDKTALRGIERFDCVVHDVGSTDSVGAVVGLISHTA